MDSVRQHRSRQDNSAPIQITDKVDIQTTSDSQTDDSVVPRDSNIVNNEDEHVVETTETNDTGEWFSTDRILKRRIHKSRRQFLVAWSDGSVPSWVGKEDTSEAAIADFYKNRKSKRRRKRQ